MKELFVRLFISNWQRKAVALIFASASWFLVNRSIAKNETPSPFHFQESIAVQAIHDEPIALDVKLPLLVVSPITAAKSEKPIDIEIVPSDLIEERNGFYYLKAPLFANGISPLFLSTVKEKLVFMIYLPAEQKNPPKWSLEVIDQKKAEETYIAAIIAKGSDQTSEAWLRNHFHNSLAQLSFFTDKKQPFNVKLELVGNRLLIKSVP